MRRPVVLLVPLIRDRADGRRRPRLSVRECWRRFMAKIGELVRELVRAARNDALCSIAALTDQTSTVDR